MFIGKSVVGDWQNVIKTNLSEMNETTTVLNEMEFTFVMSADTEIARPVGDELILTDVFSENSYSVTEPLTTEEQFQISLVKTSIIIV